MRNFYNSLVLDTQS